MSMKQLIRLTVGAVVGLAAFAGLGATAGAQCYPDCDATITIDDPTAVPGQTLTATASGLDPGTSASAVVNSAPIALGAKTVATNGSVSFSFVVPSDFTGAHSVVVTGVKRRLPITLTARFTVTAAPATTVTVAKPLARTGDSSSIPLARVGIALLALGSGAGYFARRRRHSVTA